MKKKGIIIVALVLTLIFTFSFTVSYADTDSIASNESTAQFKFEDGVLTFYGNGRMKEIEEYTFVITPHFQSMRGSAFRAC